MGVQFLILSLILRIDTSPFYRVITNVPQNYKFTLWDYQDSSVSSKCFCRIWKWDFLDHPFKRALLGSAVGLVVLLIILFGVWCIRRRELKRKKHLAILVSFFYGTLLRYFRYIMERLTWGSCSETGWNLFCTRSQWKY